MAATNSSQVSLSVCPECRAPFPPGLWNAAQLTACSLCKTELQVLAFPSLFRTTVGGTREQLMEEQEAACFYHAQNRAVVPCDSCGVFLCALCDITLDEKHLCPRCLEKGAGKGKIEKMENKRTLYDNGVLALAFLPLLFIWPTIITAPLTLFLVGWWWKKPLSIIPRNRWRMILAAAVALLEIAGWIAILVMRVWNE